MTQDDSDSTVQANSLQRLICRSPIAIDFRQRINDRGTICTTASLKSMRGPTFYFLSDIYNFHCSGMAEVSRNFSPCRWVPSTGFRVFFSMTDSQASWGPHSSGPIVSPHGQNICF